MMFSSWGLLTFSPVEDDVEEEKALFEAAAL